MTANLPINCEFCGRALDGTKATTRRLRNTEHDGVRMMCRDESACLAAHAAKNAPDTPETVSAKAKQARAVGDIFRRTVKS